MGFFDKKEEVSAEERKKQELASFLHKYKQEIRSGLESAENKELSVAPVQASIYEEFKSQYMPGHLSFYEKACNFSEKLLNIKPDPKVAEEYLEAIKICHLNITPSGIFSLSVLFPMFFILFGFFFVYAFSVINSESIDLFLLAFVMVFGFSFFFVLQKLPQQLAQNWRLKSSNQMVLCIFFIVTYMRHTSNLENAIAFASEHLDPPLAIDFKKVMWDVETQKFPSVKDSLDDYLITWKKYNSEFIESLHLIESSLFEASDERRLQLLDRSLSVILDETYEKMLHYAQNLKSPITMLYMLGIVLPILGLVMLPLMISFIPEVKWYHIALFYNIALPIMVFYLGDNVLSSRPTGYGATEINKNHPGLAQNELFKFGSFKVVKAHIGIFLTGLFVLIGLIPLILFVINVDTDEALANDKSWDIVVFASEKNGQKIGVIDTLSDPKAKFYLLEYRKSKGCIDDEFGACKLIGPYGIFSALLSLAVIVGLGAGLGLYYKYDSIEEMKIRDKSKDIEKEFASTIFQLGNRLADGIPLEIAFSRVAETVEGTESGNFFKLVSSNISRMGMSVEEAIFSPQYGAINYYPSNMIRSSMKVLVESAKKGPLIASQALLNISRYVKEIHRVNERLRDLLAEIIASMQSQIKFLTPVIAGIVIGITSMITTIISKLSTQLSDVAGQGSEGLGQSTSLLSLFGDGFPTYTFQLIVGLYVFQIVFILTRIANTVENGNDRVAEKNYLSKNLSNSCIMYVGLAFAGILVFNLIAMGVLSKALN